METGAADKDTNLSLRAVAARRAAKIAFYLDAKDVRFGRDIAETGIVAGGVGAFRRGAALIHGAIWTHVLNRWA